MITFVVADHTKVIIKNGYPYCSIHDSAMNKLTTSGIWRCVSFYKVLHTGKKGNDELFIENACTAGFQKGDKKKPVSKEQKVKTLCWCGHEKIYHSDDSCHSLVKIQLGASKIMARCSCMEFEALEEKL